MSEAQIPDLVETPDDLYGMPDQETLDAVNRGIRAAEEGRFVSSEEARRHVASGFPN
jgi:predicted transcriptional regulator